RPSPPDEPFAIGLLAALGAAALPRVVDVLDDAVVVRARERVGHARDRRVLLGVDGAIGPEERPVERTGVGAISGTVRAPGYATKRVARGNTIEGVGVLVREHRDQVDLETVGEAAEEVPAVGLGLRAGHRAGRILAHLVATRRAEDLLAG